MPQQTSQKTKCPACYFSRRMAGKLHCLRNAPALDKRTGHARWPIVKTIHICGSFRPPHAKHIHADPSPKTDLPIHTDRFGQFCKIPLTQGKFAKVDPDDYTWLAQFRWHSKTNEYAAYAVRTITRDRRQKRIYMHRLIMNTPPHLVCDHVNHDGLDNRRHNLRNCTLTQNNANTRPAKNASSKYKGVSYNKRRKKFAAFIKKAGSQIHLGYFHDEIEAARAYDRAARKYHKAFALLNFPNT
jgi:hypothetical protein